MIKNAAPFEGVKLRAVHLLRHLERVERDLEELKRLEQGLKDDRAYTARLRDSLVDEQLRLEQSRARLLQQVVKAPPEKVVDAVQNQLDAIAAPQRRAPELILPEGKRKTEEKKPKRAVEEKKKPSFNFKYD
ncbi:MAG: hypothetical protein K1X70_18445 [Leptospirales bacterium]|jgi:hypothetical protein|nr:hypothetical protein [Leptospirales bacterium]HMZ38134.1 hypothetical protein [Leptospiraceae bacterium]HNE22771.1 hypothetical protein [Leptospiraceae bacterium]HNN60244.1 hypothetical protein [Leptospiraceae bacterium]